MNKFKLVLASAALLISTAMSAQGKAQADLSSGRLTPEALWSMGRIGTVVTSPDGKTMIYTVTHFDIKANKSNVTFYSMNLETRVVSELTECKGNSPVFIEGGKRIAYLSSASGSSQLWAANVDGSSPVRLSNVEKDVEGFLFSPDEKKVIFIHSVDTHTSIAKQDEDLPLASGMVINDLMYKHWDHYVKTIPHPFLYSFDGKSVGTGKDILEGEPFECPMLPFGGTEQLAWSPDSKSIAYTCRKKVGKAYAISTDSDIFLYNIEEGTTKNLCKPSDYVAPKVKDTESLEHQSVNRQKGDYNMGYDQNPQFSPDGKYVAWSSMERDGYESDRTRLCVLNLATGEKQYVTESFESGVNEFLWSKDNRTLYFTGVWHGRTQIYRTNLKGKVEQLTDDFCDYVLVGLMPGEKELIAKRHSMSRADEIYLLSLKGKKNVAEQISEVNKEFYDKLAWGDVKERWVKTVDGKDMLCWVIYPPHFDPAKKYPTLLFCEGGPQSPVSQFWSYRWNFQIMAANDYIIIAPNRRGLPGFGMEWLEQISGDYTGLCMQDYLSAIDDICKENYVDKERLGAVGASFGGFSVYWLAGNHDKRFKCFISHDGIYNTQQQYVETEEMWFPNWDLKSAPWEKNAEGQMQKAYVQSPHLYVDKWDTPILCIHGQRDFRIEYTQAESAFAAARMRGIEAQLLLFPDENHWVLKAQNGILWQRTFFRWLDKWLKK